MKGLDSRQMALAVLLEIESNKAQVKIALNKAFERKSLTERDRAFVTFLVQGVLRHQAELDAQLEKITDRPLHKLTPALLNILRLAVYQLQEAADIPESAVVNTASQLAKQTGHIGQAKFVNGVLRTWLRSRQKGDSAVSASLPEQFSLPEWLIKRWQDNYGNEEALELMRFSQEIPLLTLRCCQLAISKEGLLDIFKTKGITSKPGTLVDSTFTILDRGKFSGPVPKLPGFNEGLFTVQDEASALVSIIAQPKAGDLVIDLCAAPGGKTLHMAELMENKGRVIAVDIHKKRLELLTKDRQRLGLTNIEIMEADGRTFQNDAPADLILVDAPCSGTGVINRRADLRHTRRESDIEDLALIQRELLTNAAKLLKNSGSIIYSTCSIEPEENKNNIKWFLETHPQLKAVSLESYIPAEALKLWSASPHWSDTQKQLQEGMLQLLPSRHDSSGFFICRLAYA
ncbi:MAG: 16S rRNA (cytosine(967)-C(5))-methyltransferase RsmB [Candidatus Obscuribacterales bacterium]|nr:16S rRNA (cytosine(967)-C(5))-methyltransferase RsmB [Candidatus Obscuribacterales bacterium]